MKKLYLLFTLCLALLGFTKANAETTITPADHEFGSIPCTTTTLTYTFSNEIQAVNVVVLQSSTVLEFPPMVEDVDYYFWGNELSINLPLEYTLEVQDLSVIMNVIDVDGQPVSFSNHSVYKDPGKRNTLNGGG